VLPGRRELSGEVRTARQNPLLSTSAAPRRVGAAPDGRLFVRQGYGGGPVSKESYSRAWRQARKDALTPAQQRSPLGRVPYQLRHAAVSLWLNAGVPATQVAEWAGHSVNVLFKVYAKCIDGQDEAARRRIAEALEVEEDDA
jgi:integrase